MNRYKDLATADGLVSGNIVIKTQGDCTYSVTGTGSEFNETRTFTNDDCL